MHNSLASRLLVLVCTAALACGDDGGTTVSGTTDLTTDDTLGATTDAAPTTGTTGDATTEQDSDDASSAATQQDTGDAPTTTTDSDTATDSTTGTPVAFERFLLETAAGPCAPETDCDGFLELLADGTLRVEKFGELDDPVIEVKIAADDLTAAAAVFADPALLAVLDSPDPLCNPPTDIFESMLVEADGSSHDATTTACDQPPLNAARAMAESLRLEYAP